MSEHLLSHLCLDIQTALLRQDQHITVAVYDGLLFHRLVGEVHVNGEPFTKHRVTVPCDSAETLDEVDGLLGNVKGVPCELRGADVDLGVGGGEVGLHLIDDRVNRHNTLRERIP